MAAKFRFGESALSSRGDARGYGRGRFVLHNRGMRVTLLAIALLFASCAKQNESADKPVSVPGEKTYPVIGKIVARDADENTIRISHQAIPGFMEAMTMDFTVRGARVDSLPANDVPIHATLHVTDDAYWVSDVKKAS